MELLERYDPYMDQKWRNCDCKGGGGGGSSGKVDYPDYMKTIHETWLGDMATAITAATTGASPFASMTAYDPADRISAADTAVCAFNTVVDALDHDADWEAAVDTAVAKADAAVISDTYIDADVAAFASLEDDQITNNILPAFQTGMRDVNAVYSSAFVMGEAHIYAMRDRDVAKYTSELKIKLNHQRIEFIRTSVDTLISTLMKRVEFEQSVAHYTIETNRIGIIAFKEQDEQDLNIADIDARWDMDVYQYGANLLAGIGGGSATPGGQAQMSKGQSAMSGAVAGASIGATTGNPYAVAACAVIGGIYGYMSA